MVRCRKVLSGHLFRQSSRSGFLRVGYGRDHIHARALMLLR